VLSSIEWACCFRQRRSEGETGVGLWARILKFVREIELPGRGVRLKREKGWRKKVRAF
jgi:hypothetical protein